MELQQGLNILRYILYIVGSYCHASHGRGGESHYKVNLRFFNFPFQQNNFPISKCCHIKTAAAAEP